MREDLSDPAVNERRAAQALEDILDQLVELNKTFKSIDGSLESLARNYGRKVFP